MKALDFLKKHKLGFIIGIIFIIMLFLNYLTPIIYDDFVYSDSKSVTDAIKNGISDYYNWGGRIQTNVTIRLFNLVPVWGFKIFNTAVFIFMLFYIMKISMLNKESDQYNFHIMLLSFSLVFVFMPKFGESILWLSGAVIYHFIPALIICFLYIYLKCFYNGQEKISKYNKYIEIIFMFLFGILVGWGNENTSGGLILFLVIYFAYFIIKKSKIQAWMFSGLLGSVIGFCLLIFAPGNTSRLNSYSDIGLEGNFFSVNLINRFSTCTENLGEYIWLVVIWFALLIVAYCCNKKDKRNLTSLALGFCGLAVNYALVLSMIAPLRACSGSIIFLAAGVVCSTAVILESSEVISKLVKGMIGALAILSLFNLFSALPDLMLTKIETNMRYDYINMQLSYGNTNIIVPELRESDSDYNVQQGPLDYIYRNRYDNVSIPNRFEGMNSIIAVPKDDWDSIYSTCDLDLLNCIKYKDFVDVLSEKGYLTVITTNGVLPVEFYDYLSKLGLTVDTDAVSNGSYIAAIYGDEIIYENILYTGDSANVNLNQYINADIVINAQGSNSASVYINGLSRSNNISGINFLVYDLESGKIMDRVSFSDSVVTAFYR